MDTEEKISSFVWIQVGIIGLVQVLLIAFVAGFIVGHFLTGSDKTVEVAPNGEEISYGTPAPLASWSLPNGDLYNHRVADSEIEASNVRELSEAWSLPLGASLAGTPVVDEKGVAYFQDAESNVFAVDLESGQEIWKHEFKAPNEGANGVTYVNGAVYGCTPSFCFSLDAQTGEEIWQSEKLAEAGVAIAPQVHNGKVFAWAGKEAIAFEAGDGKVAWRSGGATAAASSTPAIGPDGTLYYPSSEATIAVDPNSGNVKWQAQGASSGSAAGTLASPVFSEETGKEVVLDAGGAGNVYALDPKGGEQLWKTAVGNGGGVETSMALDEGVAYAVTGNGQSPEAGPGAIAAISVANGEKLWEQELPASSLGAATVANDLVFTALYDGTVVGLSRKSGQTLWEGKLPGPSASPLVVEGDTLIAVNSVASGSEQPQIVAFRLGAAAELEAAEKAEKKEEGAAVPQEGAKEEGGKEAAEEGGGEEAEAEGGEAAEEEGAAAPEEGGEEAEAGGEEEALLKEGKTAFTTNCASCHTLSEAGATGTVGPDLDQLKPEKSVVETQVTNGGAVMPAFSGVLSKEEIEAVAEYVSKAAGSGNNGLGG